MDRVFKSKPDIRKWCSTISQQYDVRDILFFGDFSNPSLRAEITRIREVSSSIIETQNASAFHKKDYTDFIMLDHIYQRAMTYGADTDVFIIFSGDGHFSSVASFLVNRCNKTVAVYGVRDCLSTQLKNTASIASEWPLEEDIQVSAGPADTVVSAKKTDVMEKPKKNVNGFVKGDIKLSAPSDKNNKPVKKEKAQNAEKSKQEPSVHMNPDRISGKTSKSVKPVPKSAVDKASGNLKNIKAVSENTALSAGKTGSKKSDPAANGQTVKSENGKKTVVAVQGNNAKISGNKSVGQTQKQGVKPSEKNKPDSRSAVESSKDMSLPKANRKNSGNNTAKKSDKVREENKVVAAEKNDLPTAVESGDIFLSYYKDIIKNISFYEKNNAGKTQMRYTYGGTADGVAEYYGHDRDMVAVALDRLCDMGYITLGSGFSKNSKVISVNWDRVKDAKLM